MLLENVGPGEGGKFQARECKSEHGRVTAPLGDQAGLTRAEVLLGGGKGGPQLEDSKSWQTERKSASGVSLSDLESDEGWGDAAECPWERGKI